MNTERRNPKKWKDWKRGRTKEKTGRKTVLPQKFKKKPKGHRGKGGCRGVGGTQTLNQKIRRKKKGKKKGNWRDSRKGAETEGKV